MNKRISTLAAVLPLATACVSDLPTVEPHDADARSALLVGGSHDGWLAAARTRAEREEYAFRPAARGAWSAPNRAQDLRATIDAGGVRVASRRAFVREEPAWELALELVAFGREGAAAALGTPVVAGDAAEVRLDHGEVIERWTNAERGFEQVLVVPQAPPGGADGALWIEVAAGGLDAAVTLDGGALLFRDGGGVARARFGGLRVTDANGAVLDAELALAPGGFAVRVDDAGAAYPIEVDPLLSAPVWTQTMAPGTRFGASVQVVGDVNADGFADVAVGAPYFDGGAPSSGAVFLYFGSPAGPSSAPDWTCTIATQSGLLARATGVGDVDADGYDDLLVGTNRYVVPPLPGAQVGAAWIWYGGPNAWTVDGTPANADWSYELAGEDLGWIHGGGADLSGDGVADFALGAPGHDGSRGRVHVFEGKPGGPAAAPSWLVEGPAGGFRFGWNVQAGDDLDQDGVADLVVASQLQGSGTTASVALFPGGPGGPGAPTWTWVPSVADTYLSAVDLAGDVDGDGYSDLLVGVRENGPGGPRRIGLFRGEPGGLGPLPLWIAEVPVTLASPSSIVALALAGLGDLNQDGYDDFAVGLSADGAPQAEQGLVEVFLGSPMPACPPVRRLTGAKAHAGFGASLDGGDVDGDGFADLLVGSRTPPATSPPSVAEAHLFLGGADPPGPLADWLHEPDAVATRLGERVAVPGDLDGDGFDELAVSAPHLPIEPGVTGELRLFYGTAAGPPGTPDATTAGGRFSTSGYATDVAGAGDVDGDGLGEVLVVGYGNASPPLGNRVDLVSDPANVAKALSYRYSNPPTATWTVRGLGDLDGDGFDDFAVGRPERSYAAAQDGTLEVRSGHPGLFGTGAGAGGPVTWLASGDGPGARFGAAVDACDVDGDGRLDLIVGAPGEAGGQGRVHVYANSAAGLATAPTWTYTTSAGEELGLAIAAGFDWNADGFEDFVVAGSEWNGVAPGSGFVVYPEGSPAGPVWPTWVTTFNQPGARYGAALANAGDLDGDGRDDVLLGSPGATVSYPKEGFAAAYSGAQLPGWLGTLWMRAGGAPLVELGASVAGGDLDGDGETDVVVGAPGYAAGEPGEGAALWFRGPLVP